MLLGTWNLKWFPSGRAEHNAPPAVTERNYESAAKEIKDGLKPRAIVFLQEVRNAQCASNLAERVGLKVAAVSSFRNHDGRTGWQQCAILTDLPVEENEWKYFHGAKGLKGNPPRGYVRAKIDAGEDGVIDCICVHLKSNYGAGKDDGVKILNRRKREESAKQLPKDSPVAVVAGDFNFDAFSGEFKGEQTADILVWSGFSNTWAGVPLELRGTHPGKGRWPDTTLDYIFLKGLDSGEYPSLGSQGGVSDHRIVWLRASRAISPRRIAFTPGLSNRKDIL